MKNLAWQIDLEKVKFNDAEKAFCAKDNQKGLFETILNQGLSSKYPQGMPSKEGRILARIYEKLDAADPVPGTLVLEEAEFEIIYSAIAGDQSKFNPAQFRLISEYAKNLDASKTQGDL